MLLILYSLFTRAMKSLAERLMGARPTVTARVW